MPSSSADRNPVELLAEEFAQRLRRGETPSLSEYVQRCPEHADEIRELFPALAMMEQLKPDSADRTGVFHGQTVAGVRPLERLGDYHILREIGRGGMGVVYEAEQVSLGRHVALKVLPPSPLLSSTFLERFHREARAAGRLHHSNIVPVFGVGQSDGVHYYAMQFIQGDGLDRVLRDVRRLRAAGGNPTRQANDGSIAGSLLTGSFAVGNGLAEGSVTSPAALSGTVPLSAAGSPTGYFGSVARLGLQAAEALAYAHRHGVLHRDVKPSNLLLDLQGTVWVTDFGLARAEGNEDLTQTGDIVGTLRFMAPERFDGQSAPQSDVYALGVTLYEMLTLRPAFDDANKARLIEKVLHETPTPPRKIDPQVPRDLETIVLKCLAKCPTERYSSAEALAEDLRCFLSYRPIRARRTPWHERAWRACRRNPVVSGLIAGVIATLVFGASAAIFFAVRANENAAQAREKEWQARESADEAKGYAAAALQKKNEADALRVRETRARKEADNARAELQDNLYYAEMNLAGQAAESPGGVGRVHELLENWRPNGTTRDRRGWEWYYLRGLGRQSHLVLHGHHAPVQSVTWSPDGRRLASGGDDGTIKLWDASTGRQLASLIGPSNEVRLLAWSPDGGRLASGQSGRFQDEITLWDPDRGRQTATLYGSVGLVMSLSWARNGKRLVSTDHNHALRVWDGETARQTEEFRGHTGELVGGLSPDGRHAALAGRGPQILLYDTETKRKTLHETAHTGWVHALMWSPTGRMLATAGSDGSVRLWDFNEMKEVGVLRGHTGAVAALSWDRDGSRLASASGDQSVRVWDVKTQKETALLRGHTSGVRAVAWSPDGRRLASAARDQTVCVWEVVTSPDNSILRGHTGPLTSLSWAPDNRRLASAGVDRTVRVWDADDGRTLAILKEHTAPVISMSWSPDGRRLASGDRDGTLLLWDVARSRWSALVISEEKGAHLNTVAWSPDGRRLAFWHYSGGVEVWDADSAKQLFTIPDGVASTMVSLSWSPDGRRLAGVYNGGNFLLWDVQSRRELANLRDHLGAMTTVRWSPDGQRIATAGEDQTIKLRNAGTGQPEVILRGHSNVVMGVSWSPDSGRIASASSDGTVKIWAVKTGAETLTLRGAPGDVNSVSWSRDGRRLASAGLDGTVRIHDAGPGLVEERSPLLLSGLDSRLEADPLRAADWRLKAEVEARRGRWAAAAADWSRACRLGGQPAGGWLHAGWWVAGPVTSDAHEAVTRQANFDPVQPLPGGVNGAAGGPGLFWRPATASANGCLDLRALFPQARAGFAYALLRLYSPREQPISALAGAAGEMRFWQNGRLVHDLKQAHPLGDDEILLVTLRAGWNSLLFQVRLGAATDWLCLWLSAEPTDRARALLNAGRPGEAAALLADLLKQPSPQPEVLRTAAQLLSQCAQSLSEQRSEHEAGQAGRQARECYKRLLALRPDHEGFAAEYADFLLGETLHWQVLKPDSCASAGGTTLKTQPDGSILASGKNPLPETYTVTARSRLSRITALRLELLPDPSLPRRGPGRAENGNMHLDEFQVTAAPPDDVKKARRVVFRGAWADFAEAGWPPTAAFDGNAVTGWSVHPRPGEAHDAVFELAEPITTAAGPVLTFTLFQQHRAHDWPHTIGRFRLSATSHPLAAKIEQWRKVPGPRVNGWAYLAGAHYLRGERQAALRVLRKAVAVPSTGASDCVMLCDVLGKLGRHEEAQKWFDLAAAALAKSQADDALLELAVELASARIAREPPDAGLHHQRARWNARLRRRPAALADLARALEINPALALKQEDAPLLLLRVNDAASRGDWRRVSSDLGRVTEFPDAGVQHCYLHALVLLHLGDADGCRNACAAMSKRFEKTDDKNVLGWVARACVLTPRALADYGPLIRSLEKAARETPGKCGPRHSLGAVYYRAGKWPEALRVLYDAERLHPQPPFVADCLFLAMTHHRQGTTDQARKWLDKAAGEIDRRAKQKSSDPTYLMELRLLQREAEALVRGGSGRPATERAPTQRK